MYILRFVVDKYLDLDVEKLMELALSKDVGAIVELGHRAEMAEKKHLTGLLNDKGLEREVQKEENRVLRNQSKGGVVIFLDAAGFKGLNGRQGERQGGDPALQLIANELSGFGLRNTDVVANPGGDDFLILMTNTQLIRPNHSYNPDQLDQSFNVSSDSKYAPWLKIQKLSNRLRILGFSGVNKHGENFTDTVTMRLTVSEYGASADGKKSLRDAMAHCEAQTDLIKEFTKQYILGSR